MKLEYENEKIGLKIAEKALVGLDEELEESEQKPEADKQQSKSEEQTTNNNNQSTENEE